ncbi:MAG: GNAT family N-acetyltransferase [Bacteroidetes bacterium]|nr:GNAT family N-acetyltransferase [Bacteroidota bacterium]
MHKIRYATTADIPLIREMTFKVWPQTYAGILTQEQIDYMLVLMYSTESLERQMKEGSRFIIVYDETEPVGFTSFQHLGNGIYKLHKLYILQTQQGKGTGRFAIESVIHEIRQKGATTLQLQVNKHNKAKEFYYKMGFEVIDETSLDIGNGFFMNDFIMEKKIN